MKKILFALLLGAFSFTVSAQTYPWSLAVPPNQDPDTSTFLKMYPDGSGNLTGRGAYISAATTAAILQPYLGDLDTAYINAGDSLVIITLSEDTIFFAGGGGSSSVSVSAPISGDGSPGSPLGIVTSGITATHIGPDAVGSSEIAGSAVGASEIATNAVGSDELTSSGVTALTYSNPLLTVDVDGRVTFAQDGDMSSYLDSKWTQSTDSIYPANDAVVYIPYIFDPSFAGTGPLNVAGRLDCRFPTDSSQNISVGIGCGANGLHKYANSVFIGNQAGWLGQESVAIGTLALRSQETGGGSVAIGHNSFQNNVDGTYNVALGYQTGTNSNGSNNTFIGKQAGYDNFGSNNVFLGHEAGKSSGSDSYTLMIDIEDTETPLIQGNFSDNEVIINGYLAAENLSGENTGDQDLSGYSLTSHTHDFASITSKPTTIAGYGITDFNSLGDARWSMLAHTHAFADLTAKPTTLAGYGIADAALDADVVHDTGNETVAGIKTFSSDPIIPDEAYDATAWNGSLEPATKNAIRDKIETLGGGGITFQQVYSISTLRL